MLILILRKSAHFKYSINTLPFGLKAGFGGARDATNIISSSDLAASVITTIGEEHLAALGGSLESIAVAKSGIIKHGRPVKLFSVVIVNCFILGCLRLPHHMVSAYFSDVYSFTSVAQLILMHS